MNKKPKPPPMPKPAAYTPRNPTDPAGERGRNPLFRAFRDMAPRSAALASMQPRQGGRRSLIGGL